MNQVTFSIKIHGDIMMSWNPLLFLDFLGLTISRFIFVKVFESLIDFPKVLF